MTAFLWFLVGLWVGCSAGFLLFASLQVSRDGERVADEGAIRGRERRVSLHDRRMQTDLFRLTHIVTPPRAIICGRDGSRNIRKSRMRWAFDPARSCRRGSRPRARGSIMSTQSTIFFWSLPPAIGP